MVKTHENLISMAEAFQLLQSGNTVEYCDGGNNSDWCILTTNSKVAFNYKFRTINLNIIRYEDFEYAANRFKSQIIQKLGINAQVFDACFENQFETTREGTNLAFVYKLSGECIGHISFCPCTEHYISDYYHNQYGVRRYGNAETVDKCSDKFYYYTEIYASFGVDSLKNRWATQSEYLKSIIFRSTMPSDTSSDNRYDCTDYPFSYKVSYSLKAPTDNEIDKMVDAASFYMKPIVDHFILAMKHASYYLALIHAGFEMAMMQLSRNILASGTEIPALHTHDVELVWDIDYGDGKSVTGLPTQPSVKCVWLGNPWNHYHNPLSDYLKLNKPTCIYFTLLDRYDRPFNLELDMRTLCISNEMDECAWNYFIRVYLESRFMKALYN